MAYTNSTQTQFATFSVRQVLTNVFASIANGVKRLQIARMHSVLNAMTDQQLHHAGIKRADIAVHAEFLITGATPAK